MKDIYFITSNEYKIREAQKIFGSLGIKIVSKPLDLIEPQNTDQEKVSKFKAKQAYDLINEPIIVDDAGLFIDSFPSFPGVYTSFIAKTIGIVNLCKLISDKEPAEFRTVVTFFDGKKMLSSTGSLKGIIVKEGVKDGMLFSDIFFPESESNNLTALTNAGYESHRSIALKKLLKDLKLTGGEDE